MSKHVNYQIRLRLVVADSVVIRYIEHQQMRDSTKLLLLNHQIHRETQELIRLLPTKSYVMDVIIANEAKLWVTWLYAPVLTTRVDRVHTTIRSLGYPEKRSPIFNFGDGGPLPLSPALYSLINRGVKVGPVGRRTRPNDKNISVRELVIDVQPHDVSIIKIPAGEHCAHGESKQYIRENGSSGSRLLHGPEFILNVVLGNIGILLKMSYHTASWGGLLYERIGKIKVLLDGELRKEWDLAKELSAVEFDNSFGYYPPEQRPEIFRKWKLKAYRTRIELGLPVIPLKDGKKEAGNSSSAQQRD
jgi:hypothetical protein